MTQREALDILKTGRNVFLTGAAGSGKTYVLREYIKYLKERNYTHHIVGKNHVDLEKALRLLSSEYKVKKVLTDTGKILGNLLMEQGFASELSLLVHPVIVGKQTYNIFGNINKALNLKLCKQKIYPHGYVWLVYRIEKHKK